MLSGHTDSVTSVAWSWNDSKIVSGSMDNTVNIWNAVTGQIIKTLLGHTDSVNSVAWSHDGLRIVSGSFDNTVKIWNAVTGQIITDI